MSQRTIQYGWTDDDEPMMWPAVWAICHRCKGEGTHVNPSIDGNGISTDDECWQDDDFREGYLSGRYDVACHECNGAGKILEVDESALDTTDLRRLHEFQRNEWEDNAAERSEAAYFGMWDR